MKMTKKWLMIAAALLLVGLTLVLSVLAFYWGDWTCLLYTSKPVESAVLTVQMDSMDEQLLNAE